MKTLADNLSAHNGILHGFFSKRGGVSSGVYETLNCGLGSSDDADNVHENRARVAKELGVTSDHLITPWQVHSPTAAIVDAPWPDAERPKVDAIVTKTPRLAVGVLTADCAPVLFCDPDAGVVAAAHAGWRGAFGGVLDHTLVQMETLGASRERVKAAVGPAISMKAYEVGEEFKRSFLEEDQANAAFFFLPDGAIKVHFDLQAYAGHRLRSAGVKNIEPIAHCTFARSDQYFSYRRSQSNEHSDYGRQISAIVIR